MREIKRKINVTENIAAWSTVILLFLSAGIVGTTELDENVPAYMWVIYVVVVLFTSFCLYYKHILEERFAYEKERRERRKALKEQLAIEMMEDEVTENEITTEKSNIYYLDDFRKRG